MIKKLIDRIKYWKRRDDPVKYWHQRVSKYGKRAVLNLGHKNDDFDTITAKQKSEIFPHFISSLNGSERLLLDYGCGPGRFTNELAQLIGGRAIGVDVVKSLLDMAQTGDKVEYRLLSAQPGHDHASIPFPNESFDIIWVCLVMGGLSKDAFYQATVEMERVLKRDGLLFLVENTSEKENSKHWKFMSINDYKKAFSFINLTHVYDYDDLGERISIMVGRKNTGTA